MKRFRSKNMPEERTITQCQNAAVLGHACFSPCQITAVDGALVTMENNKLSQCINRYNTIAELDSLPSLQGCKVRESARIKRSTTFIVQGPCPKAPSIKSITTKYGSSYVVLLKKRTMKAVAKLFPDASRIASIHHDNVFFLAQRALFK